MRKAHEDNFLSSYMKWIGHTEFGPHYSPIIEDHLSYQDPYDINHWLEQWFLVYQTFLQQPTPNKFFVNYELLCSDKNLWNAIQDTLNLKSKYSYEFFRNSKEINLNLDKRIVGMCNETYTNLLNLSFS